MKNIENKTNIFFEEIKKIEKERERYCRIGIISEEELGTNLVEFKIISDYTTKAVFLNTKTSKESIETARSIMEQMRNKCITIFGEIPPIEDLSSEEGFYPTDIGISFSMDQMRMLFIYSKKLSEKMQELYDFKQHLIESHQFPLEEKITFWEASLLSIDIALYSIIEFLDMSGDFQEFENEIKITINSNPELSALLNKLELNDEE